MTEKDLVLIFFFIFLVIEVSLKIGTLHYSKNKFSIYIKLPSNVHI